MGAGVWGWNPQLGDESPPVRLARSGRNNFWKKKVFEWTLFEQKFLYIYTAYFSFKFSFEICFFFKRTAFERKPKMKKIRKNGFRNKFFNFERTLFDQTTSSRRQRYFRDLNDATIFLLFDWLFIIKTHNIQLKFYILNLIFNYCLIYSKTLAV